MLLPPRLVLGLLAFSLLACAGDERSVDGMDTSRDGVDSEEDDDDEPGGLTRDGGRTLDADVEQSRDAGSSDARTAQGGSEDDAATVDRGDAGRDTETRDAATRDAALGDADTDVAPPPRLPAFHIPLRVHRADSGLSGQVLAEILEEVNEIWWKQAGICFEVEVVRSEAVRRDGFDLWFHRSRLGCNATANGVYCGDHDIHSLDAPSLGRADDPAWSTRRPAARTAAHELGHGLQLQHYNGYADSNDSLMSSGRRGFKLQDSELETARRRARAKALPDGPSTPCGTVPVVD